MKTNETHEKQAPQSDLMRRYKEQQQQQMRLQFILNADTSVNMSADVCKQAIAP